MKGDLNRGEREETQRVELTGCFLVVGSGETYQSEVVAVAELHAAVLRMIYGDVKDCPPDEAEEWSKRLSDSDYWAPDQDHIPCVFSSEIGETDRIQVFKITEPLPTTEAQREQKTLLPLSNDRLKCAVLSYVRTVKRSELGAPLWSIVGGLVNHGSGYSSQICRELGLDPNQIVRSNHQQIVALPLRLCVSAVSPSPKGDA